MIISKQGSEGGVYETVHALPDGLTFMCRRLKVLTEGKQGLCEVHIGLKLIALTLEHDDDYFENIDVYMNWDDFIKDNFGVK